MIYESNYTALTVLVRSEAVFYHPATGVEISRTKPLIVDFGTHGGETMIVNPLTGETERHALMHGRFYDTEEGKERFGWDDDEHQSVVDTLDKLCRDQPFLIAHVAMSMPEITRPWPTYDETHWKTIPVLAKQLGLVEAALIYERDNAQRDSVIEPLQKALSPEPEQVFVPAGAPADDSITLDE